MATYLTQHTQANHIHSRRMSLDLKSFRSKPESLEATETENRCQILPFLSHFNIGEEWDKCLCQFCQISLEPNLRYTFDGLLLGRLGD